MILWLFVALQAMSPFIHAHAGAIHSNHADFLHVHQGAHGDAASHAMAADDHGAEVGVPQGMPFRSSTAGAPVDVPPAVNLASPAAAVEQPAAGLPAPRPLRLVPPGYAIPRALAPPFA